MMATFQLGAEALLVALKRMGLGEVGGNNMGPHVKEWCFKEGVPWCAGFVSSNIRAAADVLGRARPKYSTGAKRLGLNLLEYGGTKITNQVDLLHNDIVIYHRGPVSSASGHVGHVWRCNERGYVTVEGNVGPFPAIVGPVWHSFSDPDFFYAVRLP